jgi:hypothetical protein
VQQIKMSTIVAMSPRQKEEIPMNDSKDHTLEAGSARAKLMRVVWTRASRSRRGSSLRAENKMVLFTIPLEIFDPC